MAKHLALFGLFLGQVYNDSRLVFQRNLIAVSPNTLLREQHQFGAAGLRFVEFQHQIMLRKPDADIELPPHLPPFAGLEDSFGLVIRAMIENIRPYGRGFKREHLHPNGYLSR